MAWALGLLVVFAMEGACFAGCLHGSVAKPVASIAATGPSTAFVFAKDYDGWRCGVLKGDDEGGSNLQWVSSASLTWRGDLWPMVVRQRRRLEPPSLESALLKTKVRLQI